MVSNSLADLSLDNLSALWKTIVFDLPPQPIALIFPLQAHLNTQINTQIEAMNIPIYRSEWLPSRCPVKPLRKHYRTRRGYKHARNVWMSRERRWHATAYVVYDTFAKRSEVAVRDHFWRRIYRS